jgi:PHD/YefM family antitoxin component YafN of YafNO toxin-antitoxin module
MKTQTISEGSSAAHLLQVADYLSRPQQFLAVAEARSGLRQAMDDASKQSVVLTNNGQPQAAIVPFQTLEAMRSALLQLLVGGMQVSFERLQQDVAAKTANGQHQQEATTEDELESLVRQARRKQAKADSNKGRNKRR